MSVGRWVGVAVLLCAVLLGPLCVRTDARLFTQVANDMFSGGALQENTPVVSLNGKLWALFGGANTCNAPKSVLQVGMSADMGRTWTWIPSQDITGMASATNPTRKLNFLTGISAGTWRDYLLVAGGTECNYAVFNTVWYSTDGRSWTAVQATWPVAASQAWLLATVGSRVYVVGAGVWRTDDPTKPAWTQVATETPWRPAAGRSVTVTDSSRVVVTSDSSLWISDSDVRTWSALTPAAAWSGRTLMQLASVRGNLFMVGGRDATGARTDVWVSTDEGASWLLLAADGQFSGAPLANVVGHALVLSAGFTASGATSQGVWAAFV